MQQRAKDSRIWKFLKLRKSSDPGITISESWQRDSSHADDDVTSGREGTRQERERGRSRSRGVAARAGEGTMNTTQRAQSASPHSGGSSNRGRTPSPKRNPAPQPPTPGRCPSPAPKLVSTSEVLPGDQQGWLTDQLRGRRVWCAVADMLFCVFEKEDSKVSKQVLFLPGCKVRQVEFKTASRDNRLVNGVGRRFKSKTISGVDKFQFWIENAINRHRLMFGVDTKAELDQWMEVLTHVTSVDPDTINPEDAVGRVHNDGSRNGEQSGGLGSDQDERNKVKVNGAQNRDADHGTAHVRLSPRSSTSGDVTSSHGDGIPKGSSYTPSQTLPRRIDFLSMSLSNTGDVGKGSVDDIRKRLRREPEHTQDGKTAPLKATYGESDASSTASSADTRSGRRRSFFRVGAFESLFKAKKRSASADDAVKRKGLKDSSPKNSTSSPEQTRRGKPHLARNGSEGVMRVGDEEKTEGRRAFLSRSWDGEKGRGGGLGASIRRSASDLKSRLFSGSTKSRGPGLRLGDLADARLQGYLQYKATVKWVRIWAVLCRGCFYGFKSDKSDEVPLLVFVLPQCSVQYVQQAERRSKKLLAFKLTQPHCRSLNLSAENHQDLMKWLQALQMEACKVVGEDDTSSIDTDNVSNSSVEGAATKSTGNVKKISSSSMGNVHSTTSTSSGKESKTSTPRTSATSDSSGQYYSGSVDSGLASSSSSTLHSPDDSHSDASLASHVLDSPLSRVTGYHQDEKPQLDLRQLSKGLQLDQGAVRKASPRDSTTQWGLPETLPDRQGSFQEDDGNLELGSFGFHSDADNISSGGSSASQPSTPRHDDALTQVWGRDKGYLLQLIRNKLLRRKKKAFSSLVEGETIYNKELARSHEGGLLIQQDDQASVDSGQEVLLGDSRQRSRSFTEGKTSRPPPPPSGIPQRHLPAGGWRSSPSTPRDSHHDVASDVTRRQRHYPRQREVAESSEIGLCVPPSGDLHFQSGFPHSDVRGDVGGDDVSVHVPKRHVVVRTQYASSSRNHGSPTSDAPTSNGNRTELYQSHVTNNSSVTSSTQDHVTATRRDRSRYGFRFSGTAVSKDENGNGSVETSSSYTPRESGVYTPEERSRTYAAAWDEDDDEQTDRKDSSRASDNHTHSRTVVENSQEKVNTSDTQHSSSTGPSQNFSQPQSVRVQTNPRGRPRQLPIRSQSSSKEASQASPLTPSTPSKGSHLPVAGQSSGIPQRSEKQLRRSPRALSGSLQSPADYSSGPPQSARSPSAGPPQSPRGPSSGPPQSPRGPSSGPPQSPRGPSSGLPQSPRGPPQSPRGPSSGPPQVSRSSSAGPAQSPRGSLPSPRRSAAGPPQSPRGSSSNLKQGGDGTVVGGGEVVSGSRRPPPMAVMQLAARDLQSPAMHGYLHRKTFNDQWPRYWYVLQDGCLYCYLTPDDRVTVDVTDLDGYSVTSLEDKFPGQRFVIHLDHEDYISVYLSASSREELEEWHQALTSAIQVTPRTNGHDHQEEDPGAAGARGGRVTEERVLSVKQKLLAEVLRQKQELEKKQATRLANKKQLSLDDSEVGSPPATPPTPTGEQICTLTRLRQRRMSTQIKMDTLQRQIQTNGHKKSRFHFGKKKGDETPPKHNPDIVEQLKTLSDHLSEIDRDLVQNGAVTLDRAHAHRKLQMPGLRHSYDLESSTLHEGGKTLPRANGVDGILSEESGITRSNSLKSSMQKLAHRTFARAGWRAKKSSQGESVDKDDADDRTHGSTSHDNGNSDAPDVVDLSHRLMRTWPARDSSNDSAGDEQNGGGGSEALTFLPPPSSFNGDEYSPVSSPRSARSTGSASGASSDQGHHRSNASHLHRHHVDLNNMFPLKSPRRQVDPGAMANIEAFEELSRQILGEEAS